MDKKDALRRWIATPENQPILPHFTPLPADAKGSTFGACGIRISGNPEFIDSVLSRLKDLIEAEGGTTRLSLGRNQVKPVFDKKWSNADTDSEVCYIQIRERTAKTRQRKTRELSDVLPHFDEPTAKESSPSTPTSTTTQAEEKAPVSQPITPPSTNTKANPTTLHNPDTGFFAIDPLAEEDEG